MFREEDFRIRYDTRGRNWCIAIKNREWDMHGHFDYISGCKKMKRLLILGVMPWNEYFIECARKMLYEEEFRKLKIKKRKDKFNNKAAVRR